MRQIVTQLVGYVRRKSAVAVCVGAMLGAAMGSALMAASPAAADAPGCPWMQCAEFCVGEYCEGSCFDSGAWICSLAQDGSCNDSVRCLA